MRWVKLSLVAILLVLLICSMSCRARTRYVYKPADEQIIFAPAGTMLDTRAAGKPIVTDGPNGKVEVSSLTLIYDAIIMSQGKFLRIFGDRVNGMDNR